MWWLFPLLAQAWVISHRVPSTEMHTVSFWLKPRNSDALEAKFWKISDPSDPMFRKYLTDDEIQGLVRPKKGAHERLESWISETCTDVNLQRSQFGDYLSLSASISCLESLLGLEFYYFREFGKTLIRSETMNMLSLPDHISDIVRTVFGVQDFYPVVKGKTGSRVAKEPGDDITPTVIRSYYEVNDKGGRSKTSIGIAAFEDAEFRQADVDTFTKTYNLTSTTIKVLGPNDGGYFGEASLDTQYIIATGENIETWFLSQELFDLLSWSQLVLNMSTPPNVLTISWGSAESGYQLDHMHATNAEFMKMGTKGISILTASGDDGTGKQGFFGCKKFDVNWPASSPYITTVGGTYLQGEKETGWSLSGGGFSAIFGQPSYQTSAVEAYKSSATLPASNLFNASGRALPDIAAFSTNFQTYSAGWGPISGTSASSPTVAGMIAVINDLLLAAGQPPAGFLNPVLYKHGSVLIKNDVTEGNNKHSGCKAGFPCVKGWDAVTGFGTPSYPKLKQILLNP